MLGKDRRSDVACGQLYKRHVVFIKGCRGKADFSIIEATVYRNNYIVHCSDKYINVQ